MTTTFKESASLAERLTRAREAGKKTKAELDNLNEALSSLQNKFAALNLGVAAYVPLETDEEDEKYDASRSLGFERHGTEWMFTVTWQQPSSAPQTTPLLKASKALRMECAYRMNDLLDMLILRTEREAEEVRHAIEQVKAVGAKVEAAMLHAELNDLQPPAKTRGNVLVRGPNAVYDQAADQAALDEIVRTIGPNPKPKEVTAAMKASPYFSGRPFQFEHTATGKFVITASPKEGGQ